MKLTRSVALLSGAAVMTATGASMADENVSYNELAQRLAAAEAKIAEMSQTNDSAWLSEQRSEEMRSLVYDVLADADTRSSLQQGGMTAGYNNGFVIGSSDGNFNLRINGHLQFRFVFNNRDASDALDELSDADAEALIDEINALLGEDFDADDAEDLFGDDTRYGFENRRTRLVFSGHIVDPSWQYRIQMDANRNGGSFTLLDGYIRKVTEGGLGWTFGQFKAPLLREELVGSGYQLAAERSLVNEVFTADRVQGIMVDWSSDDDSWRWRAAVHDGVRSANTGAVMYDTEIAATARAEFLLNGTWSQFRDFTSMRGGAEGTLIGVAGHYEKDESGTAADEIERWTLTADASLEFDGWNLFGAVIYAGADSDTTDFDPNPLGFVAQGGVFLTDATELFARYEFMDFDTDDVEDLNIITAGVNHYISEHQIKWTTDVGYGLDPVTIGGAFSGTGYRSDLDDDGQLVVRSQLQLMF